MMAGFLICAVLGHKWHTTASDTAIEPVLECVRCGRKELAPNTSALGLRTKVKGDAYGSYLKR